MALSSGSTLRSCPPFDERIAFTKSSPRLSTDSVTELMRLFEEVNGDIDRRRDFDIARANGMQLQRRPTRLSSPISIRYLVMRACRLTPMVPSTCRRQIIHHNRNKTHASSIDRSIRSFISSRESTLLLYRDTHN